MKTINFLLAGALLVTTSLKSQNKVAKKSLGIISMDTKSANFDGNAVVNQVRTEIEKLDTFDVKDKYDIQQFMEQNKINMNACFGKTCLIEVGSKLKCEKMLSGSVEQLDKYMVFSYRLLDVNTGKVEKTYVHEFINLSGELHNMIRLTVCEMFNQPYDKNLMSKLSKPNEFDNSNNNPDVDQLQLDGPRMGFVSYTGNALKIMTDKKSKGGFEAFPAMFQFGYQFEKQYLNEGKVQALFEFIPMVTGLDQGLFIPSITVLHGIRSNVNGWEFAFGPTFNLMTMATGYYDKSGNWNLQSDWNAEEKGKNPYEIQERVDSRGTINLQSSFAIAVGRTFKSGKLNIPVNVFAVPGRHGWRYGISFGFNTRNKNY